MPVLPHVRSNFCGLGVVFCLKKRVCPQLRIAILYTLKTRGVTGVLWRLGCRLSTLGAINDVEKKQ
jgi:hypothetical protein